MTRLAQMLRENLHFIVVAAILTLALTYPTIKYVFNTEVFWLPTGVSSDVFTEMWDVWYGKLILTGQADRFYTDFLFYPEGVSLVYHPLFIPYIIVLNALQTIMPVSNAFGVGYLLIIFTTALCGYVYIRYLFKDKWLALFGAVIFGFSPHVIGHPHHPNNAFIATLPLSLYCFQRGFQEKRSDLIILAGILAGSTSIMNIYAFVCLLITLVLGVCVVAASKYRERSFWKATVILAIAIAVSSAWRIVPMLADTQSLDAALAWVGTERNKDLMSSLVNHRNPIFGPVLHSVLQIQKSQLTSDTSFLGYLPLLIIGIGLWNKSTRRKMLPWIAVGAVFLVFRLGSSLHFNGIDYENILLPKHFLNRLLPSVFQAFVETDNFQIGALLPLAVSSCYGIVAIGRMRPATRRPIFILLMSAVVAIEYYMPVQERVFYAEQFAFIDWLAGEDDEVRLINLPMGRGNSKTYNLYQALSGFPHAEGAISRTPATAHDYIKANRLLNAWNDHKAISCYSHTQDAYLAELARLEADGFTHVVYHHTRARYGPVKESFLWTVPSYKDRYVDIYRLSDLRDSCPSNVIAQYAQTFPYTELLLMPSILNERHGTVLMFHDSPAVEERPLHHFYAASFDRKPAVLVSHDEQEEIVIQSSAQEIDSFDVIEARNDVIWLINDPSETVLEDLSSYTDWFIRTFEFCERFLHEAEATIDLYVKRGIPCSALDHSSAFEVAYDGGIRLHNLSYVRTSERIWFNLAWTKYTRRNYGFSIQFFDAQREKVLQFDDVVRSELLSSYELDISTLPEGEYAVKLILYDFETGKSEGGIAQETGQRFERSLDIAALEL